MYQFVNPNDLDVRDYVCVSLSVALVLVYHVWLYLHSYYYPHSSLESHMDYQRIWWARQVYDDVREKISTIQNFRSTMMIMAFYIKVTLVGAAASVELAVETPGFLAKSRGFFPALLFIASFANLIFGAFALFYLHWKCALEVATSGGGGGGGETAEGDVQVVVPTELNGITEGGMKVSKLHIAALIVQLKLHFRMTQRFMIVAMVAMMWAVEPVAMLVGYCLVLTNFYYCDFPFPDSMSTQYHTCNGKDRSATNRSAFTQTHDRVKGVIRPKPVSLKSGYSMYRSGMTPDMTRNGSISIQRGSNSFNFMAPASRNGGIGIGGGGSNGNGSPINQQGQYLSPGRTDGPRRSDSSVGVQGPRPTFNIPIAEEINTDGSENGGGSPSIGSRGMQRGSSGEHDEIKTNPLRDMYNEELPPLIISSEDHDVEVPNSKNRHNSLTIKETEMVQIPGTSLVVSGLQSRGARNPISPGQASSQFSSPTPDPNDSHTSISFTTAGEGAPVTPTSLPTTKHLEEDEGEERPPEVALTSDTEDDDGEDFMAMQ